ncbi:VTT domain-containing protein [Branchiibius sp. NY16-3462-2]|uniref:DedA family protein n=1 Tax=Branchiibius sp. NY16-3462-2 TaxID=1807500 RepID=UPI000B18C2CD|nr:VTT domain-containing protein [Branchiibius sp. NY16-3462-2]
MDPNWLLSRFGTQLLLISCIFVFIECGLLFPLLPGDSLLFSIGAFIRVAHDGGNGLHISLPLAWLVLAACAFAGNVVGYEIGRAGGPALYRRDGRIVKRRYLDQSHDFFERYGTRALVLGRFVPIVRTYVTLAAGVARMPRKPFLFWSAIGAAVWTLSLLLLGYALGAISFLQKNIDFLVVALIVLSLMPVVVEGVRRRRTPAATD